MTAEMQKVAAELESLVDSLPFNTALAIIRDRMKSLRPKFDNHLQKQMRIHLYKTSVRNAIRLTLS